MNRSARDDQRQKTWTEMVTERIGQKWPERGTVDKSVKDGQREERWKKETGEKSGGWKRQLEMVKQDRWWEEVRGRTRGGSETWRCHQLEKRRSERDRAGQMSRECLRRRRSWRQTHGRGCLLSGKTPRVPGGTSPTSTPSHKAPPQSLPTMGLT